MEESAESAGIELLFDRIEVNGLHNAWQYETTVGQEGAY
jgi:hypothetical protein